VTNGWEWAKGVLDSFGRLVFLVAVFGVPTGIFAARGNPIGIGIGAGLVVVVCMGEGAYQTWHADHLKLEAYETTKATEPELRFGTESGWRKTYDAASSPGTTHHRASGATVNTTHEYLIRVDNVSLVVADRIRVRLMTVEPPSAGADLPCDLPVLNPWGGISTMKDILADAHDYAVLSTFHILTTGATELEGHIRTIDEPVKVNLELWRDSKIHDHQTLWVRLPGQPTQTDSPDDSSSQGST
jgi:hypothetical protein